MDIAIQLASRCFFTTVLAVSLAILNKTSLIADTGRDTADFNIYSVGSSVTSYSNWHIPLASEDISLQAALDSLQAVRSGLAEDADGEQGMASLISSLARTDQPELALFKNIDRQLQDCIHILLGRGMHTMDEIFVTGFTLGSIKKVINTEQNVYAYVAKYLLPAFIDFNEQEMTVFKDAVRLAFISNCSPLDQFNFSEWLDQPITSTRDAVGIEEELLRAYYVVEKGRNPAVEASQRLLPADQRIVAF
jgi:hypothetical protein